MVDGSHLSFKENVLYTKFISFLARSKGIMVEAELGRLSGTEDDLTVEDYEARLTDINQVTSLSNWLKPAFLFCTKCSNLITIGLLNYRLKNSLLRLA
jgi:fructose/tagatose bisphosphate aldolase